MCVQYWPAGRKREEVYSGVGVTVEGEEQLANFMIRTIRLRKVNNILVFNSANYHFHFAAWRGANSDAVSLHRVALSLQPLLQCLARVPTTSS